MFFQPSKRSLGVSLSLLLAIAVLSIGTDGHAQSTSSPGRDTKDAPPVRTDGNAVTVPPESHDPAVDHGPLAFIDVWGWEVYEVIAFNTEVPDRSAAPGDFSLLWRC